LGKKSIINLEIVIFFHRVFEQIQFEHLTDGQFAVNATGYRVAHKINWKEANSLAGCGSTESIIDSNSATQCQWPTDKNKRPRGYVLAAFYSSSKISF